MPIPKYDEFFNPLFIAMKSLGGSASIAEQEDKVAEILNLSDDEIAEIHRGNTTKLSYRLAWARNYLKNAGLLENSARGVWALTANASLLENVDKKQIKKQRSHQKQIAEVIDEEETQETVNELTWQDEALEALRVISPEAFERLCQRLMRESGFIQVEVTGKSGDGGIDGRGVVKVGGILSFHVIFQCKRYREVVSASTVRDFRGAMVGRADKGLIITTGRFSRSARDESQRDGAPPLDLIDGEELVEKLKELRLGIKIQEKIVEEVTVDKSWFENF